MRRALSLAILVGGLWTGSAGASDLVLWVPMGDGDELFEVDAMTFEVGRRFKIDPRPHGLAVSADGSRLYLASDKTGNLQVFDARTGAVTGQVHVGNDPNQITLTKDGRYAFVPLRGEDQIAVVRLEPLAVVKRIPSPKRPHDAYTSADGKRVYVGTLAGNTVSVFDPEQQVLLHDIPTVAGVRPLEIARDGRTLYAALSNLLGFVVVDPAKRAVTRTVELGKLPEGLPQPYLDTYTHALQLSPDEQELWVTDCINDLLRVVRLSDMKEVAQVRVGHFPHWFAMRPDGKVLFVSLWYSDVVAAVDLASRKVIKNLYFPRAAGPKRIAVAPRASARPAR
jgi:DNA-binding beta-propeller fold protein YncE